MLVLSSRRDFTVAVCWPELMIIIQTFVIMLPHTLVRYDGVLLSLQKHTSQSHREPSSRAISMPRSLRLWVAFSEYLSIQVPGAKPWTIA